MHETDIHWPVFIGVGSNIDPELHITEALKELGKHVPVTGISTFYWSSPLNGKKQDNYLNGVWRISTSIPGPILKQDILRAIENKLHRTRTDDPFESRTIDLDIVLYGNMVIRDFNLTVPDPDIYSRPFLALPIAELEPDTIVPDSGKRICEIAEALDSSGLAPHHIFTESLKRSLFS